MSDEAFDATAQELFDLTMKRHPIVATFLGIHDYDHLLGWNSKTFHEEEVQLTKQYRQKFEAFDPEILSGSRPLDRDLVLYLADLELFRMEEMRFWETDPGAAQDLGEALFPLFTREFAPLETRVEAMVGRLSDASRFLEETKTRIRRPVKLWTEMAIEAAQMTPAFLEVIEQSVKDKVPKDAFAALHEAKGEAQEALAAHRNWVEEELLPQAGGPQILGEEKFRKLIELRNLGLDTDAIRALGVKYLEASKADLAEVAKSIDPNATVDEVKARVKAKHPATFEEVLAAVRKANEEARAFVAQKRLATLPPAEKLHVVETPTFIRPIIPFAAYFSPAKYDKVQEGVYIVTPPTNGEEMLTEHNYASIRNTAVHEGYPGHHLQLAAANLHPSLLRTLSLGATETVEGWAHYCEDLMRETGFNTGDEIRFVQLLDIIWRAWRIIIDIDLHAGRMSFEEAVDALVREAGMEKPSAVAEVKRYTKYPTYQLSYLLGKHLIKELRAEVEKRMGEKFSLSFFHDQILYAGSIPYFLLRRAIEDKLAKLEEDVQDLT